MGSLALFLQELGINSFGYGVFYFQQGAGFFIWLGGKFLKISLNFSKQVFTIF